MYFEGSWVHTYSLQQHRATALCIFTLLSKPAGRVLLVHQSFLWLEDHSDVTVLVGPKQASLGAEMKRRHALPSEVCLEFTVGGETSYRHKLTLHLLVATSRTSSPLSRLRLCT